MGVGRVLAMAAGLPRLPSLQAKPYIKILFYFLKSALSVTSWKLKPTHGDGCMLDPTRNLQNCPRKASPSQAVY